MNSVTGGMILSLATMFTIAGIALIISEDTGEMVLIEHLKEDWSYRLPFRLRNNRYRGLSRPSYCLLAILYYMFKAIIILELCLFYYILAGICIAIKWVFGKIRDQRNTERERRDPDTAEDGMDDVETEYELYEEEQMENDMNRDLDNNVINGLWNYGSEVAWHEALDYYYELLKLEEWALDSYMEDVNAEEVEQLSASGFYDFLHDKYFVWKYTAKNRLATTRKALEWYVEEDALSELGDIQRRLFSADRSNAEECLRIAMEIRGLGTAGASGLLAILFPESFGTVDQFVVRALRKVGNLPYEAELNRMNPDAINVKNGVLLTEILREKAAELNAKFGTDFWTPRKIDMIFWSIGRDRR